MGEQNVAVNTWSVCKVGRKCPPLFMSSIALVLWKMRSGGRTVCQALLE